MIHEENTPAPEYPENPAITLRNKASQFLHTPLSNGITTGLAKFWPELNDREKVTYGDALNIAKAEAKRIIESSHNSELDRKDHIGNLEEMKNNEIICLKNITACYQSLDTIARLENPSLAAVQVMPELDNIERGADSIKRAAAHFAGSTSMAQRTLGIVLGHVGRHYNEKLSASIKAVREASEPAKAAGTEPSHNIPSILQHNVTHYLKEKLSDEEKAKLAESFANNDYDLTRIKTRQDLLVFLGGYLQEKVRNLDRNQTKSSAASQKRIRELRELSDDFSNLTRELIGCRTHNPHTSFQSQAQRRKGRTMDLQPTHPMDTLASGSTVFENLCRTIQIEGPDTPTPVAELIRDMGQSYHSIRMALPLTYLTR